MKVNKLDHLVITANNLDRTIPFYTRVLGMELKTSADGRKALQFGDQKINLHEAKNKFEPHAQNPLPVSADICFISETPMQLIISHLNSCNVSVIAGPVEKKGATGPLLSIYIYDPDGSLIEIANQVNE
jgi:catechol 2,3-dioxygenase-like lactoylglutathione lyase family enzyme